MDDYDDLSEYNGDIIHDMYVDSDYDINTGELSDDAGDADLDDTDY
jgi:hypothetical protein